MNLGDSAAAWAQRCSGSLGPGCRVQQEHALGMVDQSPNSDPRGQMWNSSSLALRMLG